MKEAYEEIFVHNAQISPRKLDYLESDAVNRTILRFEDEIDMGKIDM